MLAAYDYPGNVRELRNLVERLAILCEGPEISGAEADALLPRGARGRVRLLGAGVRSGRRRTSPAVHARQRAAHQACRPRRRRHGFKVRADRPFRDQVEDAEREIILHTLAFTRDNVTEAARLLDLERGHFYKKMKALGIRRGGEKDSA